MRKKELRGYFHVNVKVDFYRFKTSFIYHYAKFLLSEADDIILCGWYLVFSLFLINRVTASTPCIGSRIAIQQRVEYKATLPYLVGRQYTFLYNVTPCKPISVSALEVVGLITWPVRSGAFLLSGL